MAKRKTGFYGPFLHASLLGLAVVVLLLVDENRRLERAAQASRGEAVQAGDLLPALTVHDLEGNATELTFEGGDRESLLLVFTTSCPACKENLPHWRQLWDRHADRYRIVGVAIDDLDSTRTYVAEHEMPFPVYVPESPREVPRRYGITGVPQTLHLGTDGRVKQSRLGVMNEDFAERLARL